jgi:hypothetical protein
MLVEGQWPHPGTDLLNPTLQFAGAGTTGSTVRDPALTRPAGYWNGAKVYASTWFRPLSGQVTGYMPGSFALTDPTCAFLGSDNTRYYLYGKFQAMTRRGTWFYAPASQRLYLWAPAGDSPAGHTVEIKRRDHGLDLNGTSHTTVDGVRLFGTSIRTGDTSTGVVLDRLDGRYLSHYNEITGPCDGFRTGETTSGIVLRGSGNILQRSTLAYSAGNGVALFGSNNVVWFNTIHDVDYMGSYAAGVNVVGNGHHVTRNTIHRVGRSGVNIDWAYVDDAMTNVHIAGNDIHGYSRLSVDTAAIYVCCEIDMAGSFIHHNRLHDAETMPAANQWATSGIYLDNSVFNASVHNNVGWDNPDLTVFLHGNGHGSTGNRVENNTGGVWLLNITDPTGTRLVNNLGPIRIDNAPGVTQITNFTGDARFVDPAAHDYRLRADSPARNTGTAIPGITVGHTDPNPSIGAYQYGAPFWDAGA